MKSYLVTQSLNTDNAAILPLLPTEYGLIDVLLTNILYTDDTGMQELLKAKRAHYPAGTTFHTSMHELSRPLGNLQNDTLVVDTLNMYVSNIMLVSNSDLGNAARIESYILEELDALIEMIHDCTLMCRQLIILGADVDFDFFARTEQSALYRRLTYAINKALMPYMDAYGIIMNGRILWVPRNEA